MTSADAARILDHLCDEQGLTGTQKATTLIAAAVGIAINGVDGVDEKSMTLAVAERIIGIEAARFVPFEAELILRNAA